MILPMAIGTVYGAFRYFFLKPCHSYLVCHPSDNACLCLGISVMEVQAAGGGLAAHFASQCGFVLPEPFESVLGLEVSSFGALTTAPGITAFV
jgi:hypothetical protein